jgi:type I restriction enzyme M protein
VRATIFGHGEFTTYARSWKPLAMAEGPRAEAAAVGKGTKPRVFIRELSEALLAAYQGKALIDPYTMYQHLMDYWNSTLKDDVYMLVEDGWRAVPEPVVDKKTGKVKKGELHLRPGATAAW